MKYVVFRRLLFIREVVVLTYCETVSASELSSGNLQL